MKLKIFKTFFLGAYLALGAWIFFSWIDIVCNNLDPYPVYFAWNFFTLFF